MMFEGDVGQMLYMAMARVTWDDLQIGLNIVVARQAQMFFRCCWHNAHGFHPSVLRRGRKFILIEMTHCTYFQRLSDEGITNV